MRKIFTLAALLSLAISAVTAQVIELSYDFEEATDIPWTGDNANVDSNFPNPFQGGFNSSATVLRYEDWGADYANIKLDVPINFDLRENHTFSTWIYVSSSDVSGDQPNQVSLKLQNGNNNQPWTTQTEIIKPIVLDAWQELTFDFLNDDFINFLAFFSPPTERFDFNRLVLQINGEGNTDQVTAYIDNFSYDGVLDPAVNPTLSAYTELVWADEFEGEGAVDSDKWFHQTIIPNGIGWFNNEQQHYTDRTDNSFIEDGSLHIVAKREFYVDQGVLKPFTSARLNSKFAFTYGRVVARAIMPSGEGTWPAIWMLGKNIAENGGYWAEEFGTTGWPACGEIDIMEHWGSNQNTISAALHTPSSFGATENYGTIYDNDVSEEFHNYEMVWSPTEIKFYLDGVNYYTYSPAIQNSDTWPYDADQYLLINIALEQFVEDAFEESEMVMDYIRVYQESGTMSAISEEQKDLKIYPNPAENFLVVEASATDPAAQVEVHTLAGVRVLSVQVTGEKTVVDLSELAKGAYIINYRSKDSHSSSSFIKAE
ncbi:MAG: family 16 glycosylhydrolase [Flavobacteriales bacterium]|nr:family 16 glycosylhydrolase [Flavobacteriales bacterium]